MVAGGRAWRQVGGSSQALQLACQNGEADRHRFVKREEDCHVPSTLEHNLLPTTLKPPPRQRTPAPQSLPAARSGRHAAQGV